MKKAVGKEFSKEFIGGNIRRCRMQRGAKQTDFAKLLDMDYQNYSKMERGIYFPSLSKLLYICLILEKTPNELLSCQMAEEEEKM